MIEKIKSWLWWRSFNKHKRKRYFYTFMKVMYLACPYYEEEGKIYCISENDIYREAFRDLSMLGLARARGSETTQDFNSWELLFYKVKEL